jgi:hypothetical protein
MLFPLSFPSFSFTSSELISVPRLTPLKSPRCPTILQPLQTAVYASIMRTMLAYPRFCPTRTVLQSNLSELIRYNLYDLQGGHVDVDDEELCAALEVDRRVDDALRIVQGLGCDLAWREGEECMAMH